jgi:3-methyladenine DNA glycosylase AlkD
MKAKEVAYELCDRVEAATPWNTATLRHIRREFSKRLAAAEPSLVLESALLLVSRPNPSMAHRLLAYELVAHHRAARASLKSRDVEALGRGIDSWAAVDTFACFVSGPAWREGQVKDTTVHRWARSPDRWWRRTALVSTVPLNCKARGGIGDAPRTLAVCELLIDDRDDMVVKAMSWALRELGKRDAGAVREFLVRHGSNVAARVVREVCNKLRTGVKNPRLR